MWHVQDLATTELSVVLARGLRRGLGVEWSGPLRHVTGRIRVEDLERRPLDLPNDSIHHRNETLIRPSDPSLMLHGALRRGRWTLAGRAGVSIPLGRTEENPFALARRGIRHQHLQFGTGTWDPLLGVSLGRRVGGVSLSMSGFGRFILAENSHGYRAGHRLSLAAGAETGIGGRWRGTFGVDLAREEAETWDGRREEEGNLGRTDVLVSVGVGRPVGRLGVVTLTARVPLLTRAEAAQLDYPVILTLGWSR